MTRFKTMIGSLARRLGYEIIPVWRLSRYGSATYLARLFDFTGTDCVIDVGANAGQYARFLRREVGTLNDMIPAIR